MSSRHNPWKTTRSESKYENNWIEVSEHQVEHESAGKGIYGVVHFKNIAIGIVPIDSDGYTWLVGQYRYPLKTYSWEIPEGGGPLDCDPLESAKRELKEETGLEASNWQPLLEMDLSNSATNERAMVFVARGVKQGVASPEPQETLTVKRVTLNEAFQMVERGEIRDSLSVAALLKLQLRR